MKVYIASDHAGYKLKSELIKLFSYVNFIDLGTNSTDSVDYPDLAQKLCEELKNPGEFGVLICGSGIGMSIAANRYSHIRAALCRTIQDAELARQHNNANVLVLGERMLTETEASNIFVRFMGTLFEGGRHERRVEKINKIRGDQNLV